MNNKLSSVEFRLMLCLGLCVSLGCTSAKQSPSTAEGGAGGTAGQPSYVVDAATPADASDAADCPLDLGCHGCAGIPPGLVGSWFAWQLPNCVVQFPVEQGPPLGAVTVRILINCVPQEFSDTDGGHDAGLVWEIGPAVELDSGLLPGTYKIVTPVTLTLSGEACDLVRANREARVDVFALPCNIPPTPCTA
jgi:hypothetical protein